MALSRRDCFKLKSQLVDALTSGKWTTDKINLLFTTFGLRRVDHEFGTTISEIVSDINDDDLLEIYGIVMGLDDDEVLNVVGSATSDVNWRPGQVRIFLSHAGEHKKFVSEVANELAVLGIHGYVAHEDIEISKQWQTELENALRSMQAFVALVHPEFNSSPWCHQEVGWALGRRVPRFAVRMGADPEGFLGREQWPSAEGRTAKEVADIIYQWVAKVPELGQSIIDGLFKALATAGDYISAGAAASRIAALGRLSEEDFQRLDHVWWSNDQAYTGILPTKALRPFYEANGRPWPPPKPSVPPSH
jgi:hypothetical protein